MTGALVTIAPPAAAAPSLWLTTIAGAGSYLQSGDGGHAAAAQLGSVKSIAVDPRNGDIFLSADVPAHNRIRKITKATGTIATVAGTGAAANDGDGGQATDAAVMATNLAVDSTGNLFLSTSNHIRRVDAVSGIITTIAGRVGTGPLGDGGQAIDAVIRPGDLEFDAQDNLYIIDGLNLRVRRISKATGVITTVAGTGFFGYNGDDRLATTANLNNPVAIAVGPTGDLYISEQQLNRIRRVDHVSKKIFTIAGTGTSGYNGDDRLAITAQVSTATGIAVDAINNVYFSDYFNHRVRRIDPLSGLISTYAGTGARGMNGRTGVPTAINVGYPTAVSLSRDGGLLIAELENGHILRVGPLTLPPNSIVGTVLDSDLFIPREGVHVVLYAEAPRWNTVGSTVTGADGTYQFAGVPVGRYRVRVIDYQGRFQSQWARGEQTQATATLFTVTSTTPTVVDLDLQAAANGAIVGDITGGPSSVPAAGIWVQVIASTGFVTDTRTDATGRFRVGNLRSGVYNLRFVDLTGTYPSEWFLDAPTFSSPGRRTVPVSGAPVLIAAHLG